MGRTICLLVAIAVLLAACAKSPSFRAGGYGGGPRSGGGAGIGIPF